MYTVYVTASAAKEINAIAEPFRTRIMEAIRSLAVEPRPHGCKKLKGSDSDYRIRIGTYRVIYEVADKLVRVTVTKAGHRREVYD